MKVESVELNMSELMGILKTHKLYKSLKTLEDVKVFTEYHVFAVWDFMSLLKALQSSLTCTRIPWVPNENSNTARFINEIVMGEETDLNSEGVFKSHFEMYLDSMSEIGADTSKIHAFIELLKNGVSVKSALDEIEINESVADFVKFTFEVIETRKDHLIASAFTHGREGLIPEVFIEILNKSEFLSSHSYGSMKYYLKRHIELDGDEHGPLSMKMIDELCNSEEKKIEADAIALESIRQRIKLWDAIASAID